MSLGSFVQEEKRENHYAVIVEPPYPPSWYATPHQHFLHELGLVKSGKCTLLLSSERRSFEANDVFFFPSRVAHGFATSASSGVQFVVVQFPFLTHSLVQALTNDPPIGRFRLFPLEVSMFLDLAHRIQRECIGGLPWNELQCQALLQELLVLLLRSRERGERPYLNPEQKEIMEQALVLLRERAHENVKITRLARELGLSPQHFRDLFHRYVGMSPKNYLTVLKLQRSKCMLLHAEYSITDIALRLGFGNVQQFSKAFRKAMGMSPAEWRRANAVEPLPLQEVTSSATP